MKWVGAVLTWVGTVLYLSACITLAGWLAAEIAR